MSSHPAHNELQPTGTTLPLELELEEDIGTEINHFVQLTRMGHYAEAQKFFDNTLRKHDYMFPVVAEYADMLLEQGCYRRAAEFLNEHMWEKAEILDPDEVQLLKIMKALAEIYSKGALRSALVEAKRVWLHLDLEGKQRLGDLNEVQIHTYEMYVNITVFGFRTSQWVDEGWMRCPLPRSTTQSENGFVQWFCVLREGGLLWEASRIMRALLPIMPSLPAGDLYELLDNGWSDGRSVELSVAERWASLMIVLHQAHFLLNASLLAGVQGDNKHAANQIYSAGRGRLETAERNWNTLPTDHDSGSCNLHLALEKVGFKTARSCSSYLPADPDLLFTLSNLLSEADLHHDLRNQTLVRLYILLCNNGAAMDWRDLYSILELQAVDCGNVVDYVHIWDLFTTWIVSYQRLFGHPRRNFSLESEIPTLLLSQHTFPPSPRLRWRDLLQKRNPFSQPFILRNSSSNESLTFDPSQYNYPLRFDIPCYSFSSSLLHQQRPPRSSEENEVSMNVVKTLIRHLNDMMIIPLDKDDEDELHRLGAQQHMFKLVTNGRLYFAPLRDPERMLDIGTGTGIWPIEMAAIFPNAEITGTDIAPVEETNAPENVHFLVDDAAEDDWRWDPDYFDYIRLAHLTGAMPSFKELLRKSLQHLKPGGWLECHEMDPKPMCDDGTMPPENEEGGHNAFALHDWWRVQHRSGQLTDPPRQFRVAHQLERSMRESGFVDIKQRIKKVPTNPWPTDPQMKKIGSRSERNWLEALSGWSYKPLASLGWPKPAIEGFLVDVRKAIRNRDIHCYTNYHVVIGRKPFPDEQEAS